MKTTLTLLLSMTLTIGFAQTQKFDLVSYNAPKGWKKEATEQTIQWSQEDAKGNFCIIMIFKSLASSANAKENFTNAWDAVVKGTVKVTATPEMQAPSSEDGWEAQSGYAPFEAEGQKGVAILATSTGYNKMVNILVLTNSDVYQNEMNAFFESVKIDKPSEGTTKTGNTTNTGAKIGAATTKEAVKDGFTYSTTNFTEGWTSTIHEDYVLSTKGNIKVYLFYIEKFNASDFSGTGKEARHYYWNNRVAKYFTTGEMRYNPGGALSDYSSDYIEAWANDKQTGEKRYVAMIINYAAFSGTISIILASAPDDQQFRRQFPKADLKFGNDLLPMYSFNKFAVGKNDIIGKWSSSGGGTMNWYSTTTGNNVGATGVVKGDEFSFINGNSYTSSHNGATGWVGSMNTFQQKYKGSYTVSDWSVSVSNRWDGKTERFDAWFEVVKGGRVLHFDSPSIKYVLFKEK